MPRREGDFTRLLGHLNYLPPELLIPGVDFRRTLTGSDSDLFGLSILIFKFLMDGCGPSRPWAPWLTMPTKLLRRSGRGILPIPGQIRGLKPPDYAPQYDLVPPAVRDAFYACFVDGHKGQRDEGPKPNNGLSLLDVERSKVLACKMSASHFYSGHLRRCPWCEAAASTSHRSFPRHRCN